MPGSAGVPPAFSAAGFHPWALLKLSAALSILGLLSYHESPALRFWNSLPGELVMLGTKTARPVRGLAGQQGELDD